MPFYEINWTKYGTALIQANNEDEAFDYLQKEVDYDEASLFSIYSKEPKNLELFDLVSLD